MLANENTSPIGKPQAIPNCEEMHNANICFNEKTCLLLMRKQRHRSTAQDFTMQVYCSLAILLEEYVHIIKKHLYKSDDLLGCRVW